MAQDTFSIQQNVNEWSAACIARDWSTAERIALALADHRLAQGRPESASFWVTRAHQAAHAARLKAALEN